MRSFNVRIILPTVLSIVLLFWTIFSFLLPSFEETLITQKKQLVQELVNTAHSILGEYKEREDSGELSREEAQLRAKNRISHMRYGDDSKDYFWINTMEPRMVMHPYRPDLVGENLSKYKDPRGKRLFVEAAVIVSKQGSGFIDYMWQWKDNPERIVQKVSYVKGFEPWGWIIGSGIYIEDVHAEISLITRRLSLILTGILCLTALLIVFIIWQGIKAEQLKLSTEINLRLSEKKYRELVQNANSIILRLDKKGTVLFINEFAQEFFGFTEYETIGKNVIGTIVPEISSSGENLEKFIADLCAAPHKFLSNENENIKKNGERVWIAWANKAVLNKTGEVEAILCVGNNITETKQAEKQLQRNETLLNTTQKLARIGGWEIDLKNNQIFWTDEVYRIHDLQPNKFMSIDEAFKVSLGCYDSEDRPVIMDAFRKCVEKGQPYDLEFPFTTIKGRRKWIRAISNPLKEGDRIIKVVGYFSDITEQKQVAQALKEREYGFQKLFDNMTNAVVVYEAIDHGQNFIFKDLNSAALKIEKVKKEELIGRQISEIFPGVKDFGLFDVLKRVYETGKSGYLPEKVYTNERLGEVWRENWAYKLPTGEIVCIYNDVTERKKIQFETIRTARLASIGELSAGVAHEVNNPLNAIMNCAELLKDILSEQSLDTKWADSIIKESQRIAKIVRSLLSYARPRDEEKKVFVVINILNEMFLLLKKLFDKNSVTLSVEISEHLSKVYVQPQKIQEVFMNIMINSLYAMNQKFGSEYNKKFMEISMEEVELENRRYVRIVFTDNGIGIPTDSFDRICDPFYSLKPAGDGTGLGLNICYNIMKEHDGRLLFESSDGHYTRVIVDLPAVQD